VPERRIIRFLKCITTSGGQCEIIIYSDNFPLKIAKLRSFSVFVEDIGCALDREKGDIEVLSINAYAACKLHPCHPSSSTSYPCRAASEKMSLRDKRAKVSPS